MLKKLVWLWVARSVVRAASSRGRLQRRSCASGGQSCGVTVTACGRGLRTAQRGSRSHHGQIAEDRGGGVTSRPVLSAPGPEH